MTESRAQRTPGWVGGSGTWGVLVKAGLRVVEELLKIVENISDQIKSVTKTVFHIKNVTSSSEYERCVTRGSDLILS